MTDLVDDGDRLHACGQWAKFAQWANSNWVAIRAALREQADTVKALDAAINRAETAEADADALAAALQRAMNIDTADYERDSAALAAHAAAAEDDLRARIATAALRGVACGNEWLIADDVLDILEGRRD